MTILDNQTFPPSHHKEAEQPAMIGDNPLKTEFNVALQGSHPAFSHEKTGIAADVRRICPIPQTADLDVRKMAGEHNALDAISGSTMLPLGMIFAPDGHELS
jgi:hypothetical protein